MDTVPPALMVGSGLFSLHNPLDPVRLDWQSALAATLFGFSTSSVIAVRRVS